VLYLREAVKTLLGSSFNVQHAGPNGTVTVTVNVGDYGQGDTLPLPCVLFLGQDTTAQPAEIGARAVENRALVHLHILTILAADGSIDPVLLLDDITKAIETSIRASQIATSTSYFTFTAATRDFPPEQRMATPFWWTRWVEIRGVSLEAY
jgi:hypothetical protein